MKNIFLSHLVAYSRYFSFSKLTRSSNKNFSKQGGYTLIEVLVVMLMVGVLAAIAAPSWIGLTNNQRLRSAQGQVFSSINEARSLAKSKKLGYQVSFRERNAGTPDSVVQYVIHPTASKPTTAAGWDALPWNNINFVGIALISPEADFNRPLDNETFDLEPTAAPIIVRSIAFGSRGELVGSLTSPTVTIGIKSGGVVAGKRACVTVTTILGAVKSLSEGDGASCD